MTADPTLSLLAQHFSSRDLTIEPLWIRIRLSRAPLGAEGANPRHLSGWKLHLSSTPVDWQQLLQRALPILDAWGGPFKVIASSPQLERLNDGVFGLTQVGKAATIYCEDEPAAAMLAEQLAEALRGLRGPRIPTDTRFREDAPVYFRFGPFDYRTIVDAMGQTKRLLRHPEHGDVLDEPEGGPPSPKPRILPQREPYDHLAFLRKEFLLVQLLHLSAKGAVVLAARNEQPVQEALLVKTARAGTHADCHGRDAVWALKREHALLQRLAGTPGIPEAGELRYDGDEVAALIRPYHDGITLTKLWTAPNSATPPARHRYKEVIAKVRAIMKAIHDRGIIVRDLSPENVLVTNDGEVILLDLELAHEVGDTTSPYRRGTLGFYDQSVDREAPPTPKDDLFALWHIEQLLFHGIHPAWEGAYIPRSNASIERMRAVRSKFPSPSIDLRARTYLSQALTETNSVNVYSGLAGLILLALEWRPKLLTAEMAERLLPEAEKLLHIPGFAFGASGPALALIAAGHLLKNPALAAQGRDLLDRIDTSTQIPDYCQGLAGFLAALLTAHDISRDTHFLKRAIVVGDQLTALRMTPRKSSESFVLSPPSKGDIGECFLDSSAHPTQATWPWPTGPYGTLSDAVNYGFAHGVAGVVTVLLRLHAATDHEPFLAAAREGLETIRGAAVDLQEVDGVWWPVSPDDHTCWNGWCHGTPGILLALAEAIRLKVPGDWTTLAARARTGAIAANCGHFCLCHGIASRLEALATIAPLLPPSPEADACMARDAALLASLDLESLSAQPAATFQHEDPRGLFTGAAGAFRTLLRARGVLSRLDERYILDHDLRGLGVLGPSISRGVVGSGGRESLDGTYRQLLL